MQAAGADKPAEREPDAEHDSAPAKAVEQPTAKPVAAKGKGSAIASMWSKAPPKKAGKAAPKQTPAPAAAKSKAAAVDAEAFLRLNQQVSALPFSLLQAWHGSCLAHLVLQSFLPMLGLSALFAPGMVCH